MLFAPAMGMVSFQVLGGLSWLVSVLCLIGVVRQWISPTAALDSQQLLTVAAVFAAAGLGSFWIASKIRQAMNKD
jgi:ABC-type proline/glycine betaine transport system permease subunit